MFILLSIAYCLSLHGMPAAAIAANRQPSPLYQYWIHAQEEDSQSPEYRVYRPSTYPFPPARGRDGFEIKKSGTVISHPIAAADGNRTVREKWKLNKNKQELIITGKTVRRFKIVSLSREKLTLKPL